MTHQTSQRKRLFTRLIERDGAGCHYCGEPLLANKHVDFNPQGISVDHIVPQIEGGGDDIENLVLACRRCNGQKKTKHYHEFRLAKETDGILLFLMGDR